MTNTANCYSRYIILFCYIFHENPRKPRKKWCVSPASFPDRHLYDRAPFRDWTPPYHLAKNPPSVNTSPELINGSLTVHLPSLMLHLLSSNPKTMLFWMQVLEQARGTARIPPVITRHGKLTLPS